MMGSADDNMRIRIGRASGALTFGDVDEGQHGATNDEKGDHPEDAAARVAVLLDGNKKRRGSKDTAELLEYGVETEKLTALVLGN